MPGPTWVPRRSDERAPAVLKRASCAVDHMTEAPSMLTLFLLFTALIALWGGLVHRREPLPAEQPGPEQAA
jgi:hypothetical protein